MKIYDWDKKLIIDTPFPHEHYDSYLFQVEASAREQLTYSQIEKIFLLARKDFKSGKLGFDEFSDICNVLFGVMTNLSDHDPTDKLFDVLLAGGELTFYARGESKDSLKWLESFLEEVNEYKSKK